MHVAAACGSTLALEWLINHGADVSAQDHRGFSALRYAANRGNVEGIKFLIDCGANIDMQDNDGNTPLFVCTYGACDYVDFCFEGRDVSVGRRFKTLLELGANVNIQNKYGNTPMHRYYYHPDEIFLLRAYGADREIKNNDGDTPFHYSIRHNGFALKLVEAFMSNEPSSDIEYLNIKNNDGNTPLHLAAEKAGFEYIEYLLEKGADKTIENNNGDTPLNVARKSFRPGYEWRSRNTCDLLEYGRLVYEEELKQRAYKAKDFF